MPGDARRELVDQLTQLLEQTTDEQVPVLPRITALRTTAGYMEALTRDLVDEARERGYSWEDLAEVFGTSEFNVRQRYGSYRRYDDET